MASVQLKSHMQGSLQCGHCGALTDRAQVMSDARALLCFVRRNDKGLQEGATKL
jgi:hypothetical protein